MCLHFVQRNSRSYSSIFTVVALITVPVMAKNRPTSSVRGKVALVSSGQMGMFFSLVCTCCLCTIPNRFGCDCSNETIAAATVRSHIGSILHEAAEQSRNGGYI